MSPHRASPWGRVPLRAERQTEPFASSPALCCPAPSRVLGQPENSGNEALALEVCTHTHPHLLGGFFSSNGKENAMAGRQTDTQEGWVTLLFKPKPEKLPKGLWAPASSPGSCVLWEPALSVCLRLPFTVLQSERNCSPGLTGRVVYFPRQHTSSPLSSHQ